MKKLTRQDPGSGQTISVGRWDVMFGFLQDARARDYGKADDISRRDYEPRIRREILTAFHLPPKLVMGGARLDTYFVMVLVIARLRLMLNK